MGAMLSFVTTGSGDVFAESCRRACISAQVEVGYGFTSEERHTRPADVLAANFSVTSPLTSSNLPEASVTAGSAAFAAEERKHKANDSKCAELGWVCIPIAVETYGCWGTEAKWALSQLTSRLATRQNCPKSASVTALVRANLRALLSRAISDTVMPDQARAIVIIISRAIVIIYYY